MLGIVRGRPGEHRDRHGLSNRLDQIKALGVGEDWCLARGPCHTEAIGTVVRQVAGELLCRIEVEFLIGIEGRDHGGHDPSEQWFGSGRHDLNLAATPAISWIAGVATKGVT